MNKNEKKTIIVWFILSCSFGIITVLATIMSEVIGTILSFGAMCIFLSFAWVEYKESTRFDSIKEDDHNYKH